MDVVKCVLVNDRVFSNSNEAMGLLEKSDFGKKEGNKVFYMLEEAFYLFEEKKLKVFSAGFKEFDFDELFKRFSRIDKRFSAKYFVYRDLRKKGFVLKSGLKFGGDFRVYEKGKKTSSGHSKWICFCVNENKNFNWSEFASKNRVSHSTKKSLLIGVVDSENDLSYYECSWKKIV